MLNESEWLISKAVVRGKGHFDAGLPCQDWCAARTSADGSWLAAAVCDGAGTAPRSDVGARIVAEEITDKLISLSPTIDVRGPGIWLKDHVHKGIIEIREELRNRGPTIREYHCTVVGVLLGRTGGFFFHVGDGLAVGSNVQLLDDGGSQTLSFWNDLVISPPENGEYANETFFVTLDDWDKHLRWAILPDDLDVIALMSDGTMPFVMLRGKHPNSPFIDPIIAKLLKTTDRGLRDSLMEGWLAAPETYPVTNDDKTLFIALRHRLTGVSHCSITPYVVAPSPEAPAVQTIPSESRTGPSGQRAASHKASGIAWFALAISVLALATALAALGVSAYVYLQHGALAAKSIVREADQAGKPAKAAPQGGEGSKGQAVDTQPSPGAEDKESIERDGN